MKKAIVIGATFGIGKRMAEILVAEGYKVGITGRRKKFLEEICKTNDCAYVFRDFHL